VSKEELWMLVMASMRLRLTAYSLAGLQAPEHLRETPSGLRPSGARHRGPAYARTALAQAAADLATFYERIATLVGRPVPGQVLLPVAVPAFTGLNGTTTQSSEARASEDGGVAVLTRAGDQDGLEKGPDVVRVITAPHHPHLLWVHEHLQHLSSHAGVISAPASHVAEQRRLPWWR
jgi:hypothetical protein